MVSPEVALPFADRADAGRALAERLLGGSWPGAGGSPVVLGLPRGGVLVAAPVAAAFGAPLDVLVARKIGVPEQGELAMGAVAALGESLETVLVERVLRTQGIDPLLFEEVRQAEIAELRRRQRAYRGDRPPPGVAGRPVLLVDDGLATGATVRAAVAAVRREAAASVTVAVPVGAARTCTEVAALVDQLVCLRIPAAFRAVGQAYRDFAETSDDEVRAVLAARPLPAS